MSNSSYGILKRFFPNGVPEPGSISEKDMQRIIENVKRRMREESKQPCPKLIHGHLMPAPKRLREEG